MYYQKPKENHSLIWYLQFYLEVPGEPPLSQQSSRGMQMSQCGSCEGGKSKEIQVQNTARCSFRISKIKERKKKSPPIADLLDFLSNLISPEGNEEHGPLHHFPLQMEKEQTAVVKHLEWNSQQKLSAIPSPFPRALTVSGCWSRSSISLKSTIM